MYAHTGVQLKHQRRYWLSQDHHKDYARFNKARHQSIEQTLEVAKT